MTSKTFKCVEHEEEVLEVYPFTGDEGGRKFSLLMPHVSSHAGIAFDSTTAPALALAILEVAGVAESSDAGVAAQYLRAHLTEQERATAEAEAQAKLEAEALELCNAWREANGYDALSSFSDGAPIGAMAEWLAVARCAREMAKEATK